MLNKEQLANAFVCHECDALQDVSGIKPGNTAACVCCGTTLFRNPVKDIEKPFALVIASLIFFVVANIYPVIGLEVAGVKIAATLADASMIFVTQGNIILGAVVALSSIFIPGFIIIGLFYIFTDIRFNLRLPYTKLILTWIVRLFPWGMVDVFFLGILVSLIKMLAMASLVLGPGFYAILALIFTYAAASATVEPYILWRCLDRNKDRNKNRNNNQPASKLKQAEVCHE